jgi:hypothetical protein
MVTAMRWFGLALLGILIAAGVSIAASSLASQQIGLASESISAGDALAPREALGSHHRQGHRGGVPAAKPPGAHTPPASKAPPPETTEAQPPPATVPTTPTLPSDTTPSGGEQDHGGGGADD